MGFGVNFLQYTDLSYVYHNKSFNFFSEGYDCSGEVIGFFTYSGVINDKHTLRENPLITNFVTQENSNCPNVSWNVRNYPGYDNDILSELKVFFPIPDDVEKIYEPAFEPVSSLNYYRWYDSNISKERSIQQAWVEDSCFTDYTPNQMCHYLSTTQRQINNLDDYLIGSNNIKVNKDTYFGFWKIADNFNEAMQYHFNYTKTPMYIRNSIEWTYIFDSFIDSFRGYHYSNILLGMFESGGLVLLGSRA